MKKHLIIATYDGINTYYSGVGTIAKNIVDTLGLTNNTNLRVSVAYIEADKNTKVFNKECLEAASHLTQKTGGRMMPLCNSTKGQSEWDMWRSFKEWNYACVSLVTALNITLDPEEENYIILNDTPFLFFAKHKELVNDKNLRCFYFPLSTGKNHAFGDADWRSNRIRVEQECFDLIAKDKNSKVIALGKKFAERLLEDYGLSFKDGDFLQNGLCFGKYENFLNKRFDNQDLKKYGIEIGEGKRIIFTWGRCSIAKGFKELALAWSLSHKDLPNHYLILQIPNNSGENSYFEELQNILNNTPRHIIINDFNPNIWKTVLRTENTDVVCIPSLMDPFPHTSIEAKLFSKDMNHITIISDADGAIDAFTRDEAIYVDPRDTESFASELVGAINLIPPDRKKIIDKNKSSINKFNFPLIFSDFINKNILT